MTTNAEADEIRRLMDDVFWTEKAHFVMSGVWRSVHLILGLIATIASGTAAAAIVAQQSRVTAGVAALIATLASGLLTFLKPPGTAHRHLVVGRRLVLCA